MSTQNSWSSLGWVSSKLINLARKKENYEDEPKAQRVRSLLYTHYL